MVLITGGSGSLGGAVARLLLARGDAVRVLARTPSKVEALREAGAEIVPGDVTEPASLARACEGADAVVAATHALLGRGANSSARVDGEGTRHLVDAARAAGVGHVVYLSLRGAAADHPVDFGRRKHASEEYLRTGGVGWTILRPSAFFTPHASLVGDPILAGRRATVLGRGDNPRNFVAVADVAQVVVRVLDDPAARGQVIEVGGPDNLTNVQVAQLYARVAGVEARVGHVPRAVLRVVAAAAKPLHPGIASLASMALYSDTVDESFDPSELLRRYPMTLTSLEAWIREQVEARRRTSPTPA